MTLTREQEQAHFANGDAMAVVVAHLPLAWKYARRYAKPSEVRYDDFVQAGCLGLLAAASRFEPERGLRFLTYAHHFVANECRIAHASARIVRQPRTADFQRGMRMVRSGAVTSVDALTSALGCKPETAELIWAATAYTVSWNGDEPDADRESTSDEWWSPERRLSREEQRAIAIRDVQIALKILSPRQREIAERRWMADEPETLEQIGESMGISRQGVQQHEVVAKVKLRRALASTWAIVGDVAA